MSDPPSPAPAVSAIGIAAPVSMASEVEALANGGATELYCGVSIQSWAQRYGGLAWLNRRGVGPGNPNLQGIEMIVAEARRFALPVSVTLNAPFFTETQIPEVVAVGRDLAAAGVGGLIVSDPALILALSDAGLGLALTASSVAAIRNAQSARFFRDLGVSSIILPRHLGVEDIAAIRRGVENCRIEVFVLNDGCAYEEGSCATTHAAGAFCQTEWQYAFARLDNAPLSDADRAALERNVEDYREWNWYLSNCGRTFAPGRLPNGPCGLCVIWDFCRIGVNCLKVVGREAHPARKLLSVQLVRAVVDAVARGADGPGSREFARGLRDTPDFCNSGYMCYYREIGCIPASQDD